jgi:hypothetical protein
VLDHLLQTAMHEQILASAHRLSDEALHARLAQLVARERGATAELIAHLAVLLGRKKHLGQGWGSVYKWCVEVLHLSNDAAYNRVAAARAVRRFPVILDHVAAGFLNVTTVKVLRPVLTRENHRAILAEARYRSRKECELIVARLKPQPDVPSSIRPIAAPASPAAASLFGSPDESPDQPPASAPPPLASSPAAPPSTVSHEPSIVAPLTPKRFRVEMTVGKATKDKLERVQNLMCREVPDGDIGVIFDRALDALTRELEKEKRAATSRPRASRASKEGTRRIQAHVVRAVWARDGERCAFVAPDGRRCAETRYLELHHREPHALGGPPTVENISVRCRGHNVYESEMVFGPFVPVVRETAEKYVVSGRSRAVPGRKSTPAPGGSGKWGWA